MKYGVKVLSAMEQISDNPEGIILESVLEGMAEYYSANLSQNVLRGMHQRMQAGKYVGGTVPLGYSIDNNKDYVVNPQTSHIVKQIFEMYAAGNTVDEINTELNSKGYKTATGKNFSRSSLHSILKNEKYIGRYKGMDIVIEDVIPKIIDKNLFDKVQKKVIHNKKSPASSKSPVKFHLTGKLFCGKCLENMVGDSGTSSTGTPHYYYSCINKKLKRICDKKSVKKDWIENVITNVTINEVLTDENIKFMSKKAFALNEIERRDNSVLIALQKDLRQETKIPLSASIVTTGKW